MHLPGAHAGAGVTALRILVVDWHLRIDPGTVSWHPRALLNIEGCKSRLQVGATDATYVRLLQPCDTLDVHVCLVGQRLQIYGDLGFTACKRSMVCPTRLEVVPCIVCNCLSAADLQSLTYWTSQWDPDPTGRSSMSGSAGRASVADSTLVGAFAILVVTTSSGKISNLPALHMPVNSWIAAVPWGYQLCRASQCRTQHPGNGTKTGCLCYCA